ncbi:MAG TPA: TetR/AcrR family transcriptional regulator [Gemmatimonadales bacterium]
MKKQKTVDRRVQRTRRLLQDALVATVIEKGYEAATVQDIIDRADVGRATFYAHFADKQTLLTSRLEDLRGLLLAQQRQSPGSLGFSLAMLEHARSHLAMYRAIVGHESGAFIIQRIHRTIADLAANDVNALAAKASPQRRQLAVEFVAGAFMAVLTWWLDQGAALAPAEVDAIFRRLVLEGLAKELQPKAFSRTASPNDQCVMAKNHAPITGPRGGR